MKTPEKKEKAINEIIKKIQYFQYNDDFSEKFKRDFRPR